MVLSVAKVDAVTLGWRVAGLVTIGPTVIRWVDDSTCEKITLGSCHSRCESNVQKWSNPSISARRA